MLSCTSFGVRHSAQLAPKISPNATVAKTKKGRLVSAVPIAPTIKAPLKPILSHVEMLTASGTRA